jgi:hypothetical protein
MNTSQSLRVFISGLLFNVLLFSWAPIIAGENPQNGCDITGPKELIPESYKKVKLGMTLKELEQVLGKHDYSL